MTILPTLKKLIPSEPTLLSDQNLWSNSPYGHSFLQFWTNERTSNCSVNTHWVDWSDSSHTRPPVTGLKYHTIGCVALWKRVSNLFFRVHCLCFRLCAIKCHGRLFKMTKTIERLCSLNALLEHFCTFMIKPPLNPLRCCFTTLLFFLQFLFTT